MEKGQRFLITGGFLSFVYLIWRKGVGSINKACPLPTQDQDLNGENRQRAKENFMYGPLNENAISFWTRIADYWKIPVAEAQQKRCGNCTAYDQSPRMKKCMNTKSPEVGYCWMHKFKCASYRTCNTWAEGGPVKTDKKSYAWQK